MHDALVFIAHLIGHALHAIGIQDRAFNDLVALATETFIICGLLGGGLLKLALHLEEKRRKDGGAAKQRQPPSGAQKAWNAIKAIGAVGAVLAASFLIASYLNS